MMVFLRFYLNNKIVSPRNEAKGKNTQPYSSYKQFACYFKTRRTKN